MRFRNQQLRDKLLKQLIHVQQERSGIPNSQLFTQRATFQEKPTKLMNWPIILINPVISESSDHHPGHGCRRDFTECRI